MAISKKWIMTVMLFVAVLCVLVWYVNAQGSSGQVQAAQNNVSDNKQIISVVGQGEIEVDPDVAYISLGIHTDGKDAKEAQSKNAEAFNELKKALLSQFKIAEKDLKTTSFNVHANYQYHEKREPNIVSYTARHNIQITYRELDNVGALLDAATKAGANQINRVQFSTEQSDQYQLKALEEAMANAKSKADVIAKSMGESIKGTVSVTESGFSGGHSIYADDMVLLTKSVNMDSAEGSTPISAGQIKISAQVNVQYEF